MGMPLPSPRTSEIIDKVVAINKVLHSSIATLLVASSSSSSLHQLLLLHHDDAGGPPPGQELEDPLLLLPGLLGRQLLVMLPHLWTRITNTGQDIAPWTAIK